MQYFYGAERDLLQIRAILWNCHLLHIIKIFLHLVFHLWRSPFLKVLYKQLRADCSGQNFQPFWETCSSVGLHSFCCCSFKYILRISPVVTCACCLSIVSLIYLSRWFPRKAWFLLFYPPSSGGWK